MERPSSEVVEQVREAFAALARFVKRVSTFRHATDQHGAFLAPALAALLHLWRPAVTCQLTMRPGPRCLSTRQRRAWKRRRRTRRQS